MALLTVAAHRYLHDIEMFDIGLYNKINDFFKEINERRVYPSKEEYAMINDWLRQYETRYRKVLRKRIELKGYNPNLIKELIPGYSLFHPTNFRMNLQQGVNLYDERVVETQSGKLIKKRKLKKR